MIAGKAWLFVACVGLWASCASLQDGSESHGVNEGVNEGASVVRLERSPCYGPCPTYTVEVFEGGRAAYHGVRFVEMEGDWQGQIKSAALQKVLEIAREMHFDGLDASYDNPRIMDLPSQTFTIEGHTVMSRYGGPDFGPLKDAIESMVAGGDWHKE
jgi:hypothetical protein